MMLHIQVVYFENTKPTILIGKTKATDQNRHKYIELNAIIL